MGERTRSKKHASVDSGLGLADEHSDTTIGSPPSIMQSEGNVHNNNDDTSNSAFLSPLVRPNSIPLTSVSSDSDLIDENLEALSHQPLTRKKGNGMGKFKFKEEDEMKESPKTTSPSSGMRGLAMDSICKDGMCIYNFNLTFCGDITLDKRMTQPMLPWIIAEKRRDKKLDQRIFLQISGKGAIGISESQGLILFHHTPTCISRFCRGHDKKSVGYLWRPDNDSNFKCFVFEAADTEMIQNVVTAVRDATRDALMEESTSKDNEAAIESLRDNTSTMFEVLYCGRVAVSHKRAPPSLIDDTIERFKQHEVDLNKKRLGHLRKRHYSAGDQDAPDIDNCDKPKPPVSSLSEDKTSTLIASHSIDGLSDTSSISSDSSTALSQNVFLGKDAFYNVVREEMRVRTGSTGSNPIPYKSRCESDSATRATTEETGHNRTMLFQIGKTMLTLISPDQKSFMLTKKFRDISFCSQGIQQPEYFGFICREKSHNSNYMCYVFKCESEAVVESIMGTLRQAFNTALANSRLHVICETCPMHQLHKLCEQVQGHPPDKVHTILNKQLQTLTEIQRDMVNNKLKLLKPVSQQNMNELVMGMLRAVCEEQQKIHTHIGESGSASDSPNSNRKANKLKDELNRELFVKKLSTDKQKPSEGRKSDEKSKEPESRFKKAKKSLTTSFENLLNRSKRTSTEKQDGEESTPDQSPEDSGFANTGYTSRRNTMTESDADLLKEALTKELLKKSAAEKSVGDSPGPGSRSDSPVPITSTPSSIVTSPSSLTNHLNPDNSKSRPMRMSTEDHSNYEMQSPPVIRPRSKTLGDLPSPREGPVVDQIFKTPVRKPEAKKPLARAMSFDERSPRSPRTPFMTPSRRSSWRQQIFQRVVTPMGESKPVPGIVEEEEEGVYPNDSEGGYKGPLTPPRFTSKTSIRAMWRKAIMEQILLIRMERENINLKARQDAAQEKRIKLNYEELNPCLIHATKEWEKLLLQPNKSTAKVDEDEINRLFKQGVPRGKRGEIWTFMVDQHRLRKHSIDMAIPHHEPYGELIKKLTSHQHSILIDLGRTFPTHAYFANPLGRGQLSLFNLLKAFSLLDEEVGYCQGLSFVAGVLLMHMDEEEAFEMLVYLMFGLGFRRQYRPDMTSLQIQMYQLERLLHDHHRRLHDHLQINDIAPSLYAAPWFLTIFASQFPLGFVSKVFDLIFLQGFDVIFKVALLILGIHEELLLACNGFEATIEFLKNNLPILGVVQMEKVINQAYNMDISKELHSFEVEYHIFQEEMIPTPMQHNNATDVDGLEKANRNLRRQNNQLLEQLQSAHNTVHNHEETISSLRESESSLKSEMRNLNLEREALLNTVSKLRTLIPENVLQEAGINFTAPIYQHHMSTTSSNNRIGLADLKRLNKEAKDTCIDENDGDVNGGRDSKRTSQRSSDSSISNISSDIDSPIYGNKN